MANDPVRISLPNQFRMAIGLIRDNGDSIMHLLDDMETQANGIDSDALVAMIDTIEVATRLARTEVHRALKQASYRR